MTGKKKRKERWFRGNSFFENSWALSKSSKRTDDPFLSALKLSEMTVCVLLSNLSNVLRSQYEKKMKEQFSFFQTWL